jgi:chromatin segregation and condensation protein Rec8/ScpA/Scc1 (kleisin family)
MAQPRTPEALGEAYLELTRQQRLLLEADALDDAALAGSLKARQALLPQVEATLKALPEGDPVRAALVGYLREARDMDEENLRLASRHHTRMRTEARQQSQTRKGVSGYSRTDLAGGVPSTFDKKQ